MSTPAMRNIKKGTIIAPHQGWEEKTYYKVELAYCNNNTIHVSIFYSGFLNGKGGIPGGYNCILSPTVDGKPELRELYYLRVIKKIKMS